MASSFPLKSARHLMTSGATQDTENARISLAFSGISRLLPQDATQKDSSQ
jgi:hypothetical protein